MSLDATTWAWSRQVGAASQKMVLLSLADRAGEDHTCYPSIDRLVRDTELNRKTVLNALRSLQDQGLIRDTGERKGKTNRVRAYQLMGVADRHQRPAENSTEKGTITGEPDPENGTETGTIKQSQNGDSSKNGMVPELPDNSPNSGSRNSPNFGTQNQSGESTREPNGTSEPAGRTLDAPPDLSPPTDEQIQQLAGQSQPADESAYLQDGKRWGTVEDVRLALRIGQLVDAFLEQDAPPRRNIATWANDIRLMRHQDGRELRHIKALFEWAHSHHFWASNILSPSKLRGQWAQLAAQRKREREAAHGGAHQPGSEAGGIDYTRTEW